MFVLLAGVVAAAGCYTERLPPPTFRYRCDEDGDCDDTERCVRNLCQIPCTQLTASADCPRGYVGCLNGSCASLCMLEDDACPSSQSCVDVGLNMEGGSDVPLVGACGESCRETGCPSGEICAAPILDVCVLTCDAVDLPCPADFVCYEGGCLPRQVIPESTGSDSGSESGSASSSEESST